MLSEPREAGPTTALMRKAYARWAPVYDRTFGAVTNVGRRRATALLSELGGSVLEVGVGTGLALRHYDRRVSVTGVDYSAEFDTDEITK